LKKSLWITAMAGDNSQSVPKKKTDIPQHIAIVMDGNGRWARKRLLPRPAGHREGAKAVLRIVRACVERGVSVLTLFAFSSENWQRPPKEVNLLMELFLNTLRTEVAQLHANNIRVRFIGDRTAFAEILQSYMHQAETQTAGNTAMTLIIAANYGGRWDIVQAARQLARDVLEAKLTPTDIMPEQLQNRLCLSDLPEPDLFIRTGGEQRISNFLLWQMAYTELYFTEQLWPDYDIADLNQACASFAKRQRRFGRISDE
jgi:undecaprenyl diphosphate synthase